MPLIYDVIHGHIHIADENLKFIDNRWMKRLKRIKQLGLLDHVFTSASHTRFEHVVGVYHLATKYMTHLEQNSETKNLFTAKERRCVQLAALFHDLGHGPFSHVFDDGVLPNVAIPPEFRHHESRSLWMVDGIFAELESSEFSPDDITMIKNMIEPSVDILNINSEGIIQYMVDKPYLYQIVNNKTTGLDVDKFDYLQRDTYHIGLDYSFSPERIFHKSKICPKTGHIIYHSSIRRNIYKLFYTRYKLHRDIYNHKAAKIIELMLADSLILSAAKYNFASIDSLISLDDSIYNRILFDMSGSTSANAQAAAELLARIDRRDLYTCLYYGPKASSPVFDSDTNPDIHKIILTFNLCNRDANPLNNVTFYGSATDGASSGQLFHNKFAEELVMYYTH